MPNKFNSKFGSSKGHPTGPGSSNKTPGTDKTAAWPGVPGKTQSKPRDKAGTRKARQSARQEGVC